MIGLLLMVRLVWYLFCDHHLTDANGKNSYIGVFDTMSVRGVVPQGTPAPKFPLAMPLKTASFVLALKIDGSPDTVDVFEVRMTDQDGQDILPTVSQNLPKSPEGKRTVHLAFPNGIPVFKRGIYEFALSVNGVRIGQAQIPVSVDFVRGEEGR